MGAEILADEFRRGAIETGHNFEKEEKVVVRINS